MPLKDYTVSGLYSGLTLSELLARSLDKLKQAAGNYDRYSRTSIINALNDGLVEAVKRTRCLHSFAIIEMKDGYSQYKPPEQLLLPKKAFFYKSATSYYELKQHSRKWLDQYNRGWRTMDGDPRTMYPGDNYGNLRKLGFTPTPDTDGTSYVASPDTGVYTSETGMTTSGNVTGTNTTAHATTCTDTAARTLSDEGVLIGMMAVNVTDDSKGQITAVSGSTFSVTLAGGTANTWAVGDSFLILAGEYGVVTSWTDTEQYLFTSEIGGMVDVQTIENNVYLEFIRRPLFLQFGGQYPELPPELHQFLPDYVPYQLKRTSPKGSNDLNEAMLGLQAFEKGIDSYIDLDDVPEDEGYVRFNL